MKMKIKITDFLMKDTSTKAYLIVNMQSKMNTSNGQFHIYAETSVGGKETQKQMDGGNELTRKLLARKYQEISNEGFE